MEKLTSCLINKLSELKDKKDIIDLVDNTHKGLKNKLFIKGTKFFEDISAFSQDIIGGQTFYGLDEVTDVHSYEEINYIRVGLKTGWVTMIDDNERFDSIKNEVKNIITKFDL